MNLINNYVYMHYELYPIVFKYIEFMNTNLHFCSQINSNFSFQLLIISIICLDDIILVLHTMYQYMKAGIDTMEMMIYDIIAIIAYALRFLYISYLCQRSRNEVEYHTHIHTRMQTHICARACSHIYVFTHYIYPNFIFYV